MQTKPLTAQDSLNDWLIYVYGIHVSAIDLGLSRVLPVFEALNICLLYTSDAADE